MLTKIERISAVTGGLAGVLIMECVKLWTNLPALTELVKKNDCMVYGFDGVLNLTCNRAEIAALKESVRGSDLIFLIPEAIWISLFVLIWFKYVRKKPSRESLFY
jgi:hypothetical protein